VHWQYSGLYNAADFDGQDCGVTHYHDSKIREALSELAPTDKTAIEATKFGEIKGS